MAKQVNEKCLEWAVEITKAAVPMQSGTWVNNPKQVAEFIETVAEKLDVLWSGKG
jgi:hypothetical protein